MRFIFLLLFTQFIFAAQVDTTLYEGDIKERFKKIEESFLEQNITTAEQKEQLEYNKSLVKKIKSIINKEPTIIDFPLEKLSTKTISQETYSLYFEALKAMIVQRNEVTKKQEELQEKIAFLKKRIEKLDSSDKDLIFSLQMQFAIYKLQQLKSSEELQKLEPVTENLYTALLSSIDKVTFKDNTEILEKIQQESEKYDQKIIALQVKKERQLITTEKVDLSLEKELTTVENENQKLTFQHIDLILQSILVALKEKDSGKIFTQLQTLEYLYSTVKPELNHYKEYDEVLQKMIVERLGTLNAVFANTQQTVQKSLLSIYDWIMSPLFTINEQSISLFSIFKVIIILIVGFIIGWLYKRKIISLKAKWPKVSQMSIKLLANIGYYVIMLITFFIALVSIGLDLTSLSLIAGALSIGVGFGLQTVVSNFVAGIILMFERSIRIGDLLEITDTLKGEVTDIRIRSTTIRTLDNIEIIVPNATFIQSNVINWTLEDSIRRLTIPFSVAYGTDFNEVSKIIIEALKNSNLNYLRNVKDKEPKVRMSSMAASSVDLDLLVWINADSEHMPFKSDFLVLIYKTLNEHEISIPFPQLDVHLKKE